MSFDIVYSDVIGVFNVKNLNFFERVGWYFDVVVGYIFIVFLFFGEYVFRIFEVF